MINRLGFLKKILLIKLHYFFVITRKLIRKNKADGIAVIALLRLGDTVFSIPAVRKIISAYPGKEITILCYPESEIIYKLVLKEINCKILKKSDFRFGRRFANKNSRKLLKDISPGVIIDLTCSVASASLIFNSSAREIIGCSEHYSRGIYTKNSPIRKVPHLIDHYLDSVNLAFDFKREKKIYEHPVNFDKDGEILVHPLSVRKAKEWNLNKYISLVLSLMEDYKVRFIFPEGSLSEDIIIYLREKNIPYSATASLEELIDLIKKGSLYISNDTGPLYIAGLLGKPTFTIYGPSNPDYSFPFGEHHQHIKKIIPCTPLKEQSCFTLAGVDCNHYDCMNLLTLTEVEKKVREFINKEGIHKKAVFSGGIK